MLLFGEDGNIIQLDQRHDEVFKMIQGGIEDCFPFINLVDPDKVRSFLQVYHCENGGAISQKD